MAVFKVNKTYEIKDVKESLEIGMEIYTNGDDSYTTPYSFWGTITAKTETHIYVKRADGETGEGPNGAWSISLVSENPISVMQVSFTSGVDVRISSLKFGDVISIDRGENKYVVVQKLADGDLLALNLANLAARANKHHVFVAVTRFFRHPEFQCDHCDRTAVMYVDNGFLCETHATELSVKPCHECGRFVTTGNHFLHDRHIYCETCHQEYERRNRVIQNYSYKPEPIFLIINPLDVSLSNKILAGVEQEVECKGSTQAMAKALLEQFCKKTAWCYLKGDGSLSNGFELVTHPANLEGHYTLPWEQLTEFYKKKSIYADDTETCGLHIHTNKHILKEEDQIKLAYFINSQRDYMETLARRPAGQWAQFKKQGHPIAQLNKSERKYEALNWTPPQTVEFRLFKGTTRGDVVLASIEFVHAAIMFSSSVKLDDLKAKTKTWPRFLEFIATQKYRYLLHYFKERGLT